MDGSQLVNMCQRHTWRGLLLQQLQRYSGTTCSGSVNGWSGCIATFKAAGPSMSLSPTSGPVGTSVTVSGSGFIASHSITITYGGSTVATTTSDSSGSIPSGVSFNVPASVAGSNTVQASDGTNAPTAIFTVTSSISLKSDFWNCWFFGYSYCYWDASVHIRVVRLLLAVRR